MTKAFRIKQMCMLNALQLMLQLIPKQNMRKIKLKDVLKDVLKSDQKK